MLVYSPSMIATLCILSKTQSALAQVEGHFLNYRARKQVAVSRVTSATNLVSFAQHSQLCSRVCEPPDATRNSSTLGSVRVRRCEPITCQPLVSGIICVLRSCPHSRQMIAVVCVWSHSRIAVWRCRSAPLLFVWNHFGSRSTRACVFCVVCSVYNNVQQATCYRNRMKGNWDFVR